MQFDGCRLNVRLDGTSEGQSWSRSYTFKAVSGKKDGQQNSLLKYGPIPDGSYSFNLSSVEYRYQETFIGTYSYPDWAYNRKISGGTSNEADAYGNYRVKLTVEKYDTPTLEPRGGFYLHGSQNGNGFGSAGCIDLGTGEVCNGVLGGLYDYYQATSQNVKVNLSVKRTCDPWAKPKEGAGKSKRP